MQSLLYNVCTSLVAIVLLLAVLLYVLLLVPRAFFSMNSLHETFTIHKRFLLPIIFYHGWIFNKLSSLHGKLLSSWTTRNFVFCF